MTLSVVPSGFRVEKFTYANGEKATVYRAPHQSEGPTLVAGNGRRVLYYMYAFYVFQWPEGTTQLDIGHGYIDKYIGLQNGITITGVWSPERLAEFGQQWARQELERHSQ